MRVFNRREKILLAVAAVVLGVFGSSLALKPAVDRLLQLGSSIAAYESRLKESRALLAREIQIKKIWEGLPDSVKNPGKTGDDLSSVLDLLEEMSRRSGLRLSDVRPYQKQGEPGSRFRVNLKQEGDIMAVIKFIYELESAAVDLQIERLRLSSRSGSALEVEVAVVRP